MYILTGEASGCETEVVVAVVAALQTLALKLGKSSYISVNLAVSLYPHPFFFIHKVRSDS
jgi:hypothetical protein